MKKVLLLGLILVSFWSCSTDDATNEEFNFEILPVDSVTMPERMHYNDVYTIDYTYFKPSSCHFFNDLYYITEGNNRTIAVINTVLTDTDVICEPFTDELIERSFTFYCGKSSGTYIFKFWQGENEDGEDLYLVYEIPVGN